MKNNDWVVINGRLSRELKFASFPKAISFMVQVSFEAEKRNHHPEWKNVYNMVFIELITHDSKSISEKDYGLAQAIDLIYESYKH